MSRVAVFAVFLFVVSVGVSQAMGPAIDPNGFESGDDTVAMGPAINPNGGD